MRLLFIVGLIVASSQTAFAGDAIDLVCSGIANPTEHADRVAISIHYRDVRAKDGVSRNVVLRELVGDVVFKASHVIHVELDRDVAITLASGKQVRFRGTYALTKPADELVLHLVGKVGLHPVDVKLPCVDLST